MIRSIRKDVIVGAAAEVVEDIFTTPEGERRRVVEIWCEQGTGNVVRAYMDQDRVVDVDLECDQVITNGIPVDLEVPPGRTFKAGFYSTAGATIALTVFIEE